MSEVCVLKTLTSFTKTVKKVVLYEARWQLRLKGGQIVAGSAEVGERKRRAAEFGLRHFSSRTSGEMRIRYVLRRWQVERKLELHCSPTNWLPSALRSRASQTPGQAPSKVDWNCSGTSKRVAPVLDQVASTGDLKAARAALLSSHSLQVLYWELRSRRVRYSAEIECQWTSPFFCAGALRKRSKILIDPAGRQIGLLDCFFRSSSFIMRAAIRFGAASTGSGPAAPLNGP